MFRLASILYSVIGTSLAGTFIIAALSTGYDTQTPIIVAAILGAVFALPVTYFVAQAIIANKR